MRHFVLAVMAALLVFFAIFFFSISGALADEVTFAWDANTESDLKGYRLYTSKYDDVGSFNAIIDIVEIDNVIPTQVTVDIQPDTYVRLTAFDTNYNESDFSDYVFYETTPPAATKTLRIVLKIEGTITGVIKEK